MTVSTHDATRPERDDEAEAAFTGEAFDEYRAERARSIAAYDHRCDLAAAQADRDLERIEHLARRARAGEIDRALAAYAILRSAKSHANLMDYTGNDVEHGLRRRASK